MIGADAVAAEPPATRRQPLQLLPLLWPVMN
jgi:hypothetical protein